jgi:methyl-accepting chemotaxis protein
MRSIGKWSVYTKFILIFLFTLLCIAAAVGVAFNKLQTSQHRITAKTVVGQFMSFRNWLGATKGVWVDNLNPEFQTSIGQAQSADGTTFHWKPPAVAVRELSQVVSRSDVGATVHLSSDNARNPDNNPDAFELTALKTFREQDIPYLETYTDNVYRYSIPFKIKKNCLKCHGNPDDAPAMLIEQYGKDLAFNYKVGDIRGILTVNLPKMGLLEVIAPFLNVYTFALLLLGLVANFIMVKKIIIDRINTLTGIMNKITSGTFDIDIKGQYRKNSNDELDKLYHSVELMKKGFKVLLKKLGK